MSASKNFNYLTLKIFEQTIGFTYEEAKLINNESIVCFYKAALPALHLFYNQNQIKIKNFFCMLQNNNIIIISINDSNKTVAKSNDSNNI